MGNNGFTVDSSFHLSGVYGWNSPDQGSTDSRGRGFLPGVPQGYLDLLPPGRVAADLPQGLGDLLPFGGISFVPESAPGQLVTGFNLAQAMEAFERRRTLVDAQDDARQNPDYAPGFQGATHCNQATADIARAAGAPMAPFVDEQGNPVLANQMAENLAHSGEYREVSSDDAQRIADDGGFVVGVTGNPGGHGHIATVRPEGVEGDAPNGSRGPLMNNIGATNGVSHESAVWRRQDTPTFYTPVDVRANADE
jgi:hypothetical protein